MIDDLLDYKWRDIEGTAMVYRIAQAYVQEHRTQPCCPATLRNYFKSKKRNRNAQPTQKKMPESTYRLKPGQKLFIHSMGLHVSQVNLTDELAAKALEENPRLASHFDFIPAPEIPEIPVELPKSVKSGKRKNK